MLKMSGNSVTMSTYKDTDVKNSYNYDTDDDEHIEYDVCRIKRDWDTGEEGSLIGRGILDEMENEAQHIPFFTKLFTLSQVVGILSVVLVGVWCGYFRGGFAWFNDPTLQFNWHPFLMTLGLVFFYANGAMIYRGFRSEKKKKLKILHMLIQLSAFIFSIVGLVAVFDFHNKSHPPIPNMYSLHSWVGLCTVILFACQWLVGLLTFLFPGLRPSVRAAYLPIHQFFGLFIFVGAVASCLLGLTEKAIFSIKPKYSALPTEGILVNVIGLALILFGGLVVYLVSHTKFRRQTTEDEVLLTDTVLE